MVELEQRAYKPIDLAKLFCFKCHESVPNEMARGNLRHVKLPAGRICFPEHIREYLEAAEMKAAERVTRKLAETASK
jgi:hypothetical protein